jgi:hypothetical protein
LNFSLVITRSIPLKNDTSQTVPWPSLCPSAEIDGLIMETLIRGTAENGQRMTPNEKLVNFMMIMQ